MVLIRNSQTHPCNRISKLDTVLKLPTNPSQTARAASACTTARQWSLCASTNSVLHSRRTSSPADKGLFFVSSLWSIKGCAWSPLSWRVTARLSHSISKWRSRQTQGGLCHYYQQNIQEMFSSLHSSFLTRTVHSIGTQTIHYVQTHILQNRRLCSSKALALKTCFFKMNHLWGLERAFWCEIPSNLLQKDHFTNLAAKTWEQLYTYYHLMDCANTIPE